MKILKSTTYIIIILVSIFNFSSNAQTVFTYNDASGSFDDGSGSADYNNFTNNHYLISVKENFIITITFTEFNTESGWDFVNIYDGATTSALLLGSHSGNIASNTLTYTSSSNNILIVFTSDGSVTRSGWEINYVSKIFTPKERLKNFYKATEGENWTIKWDTTSNDVSSWYGVVISDNKIVELNLPNNNLCATSHRLQDLFYTLNGLKKVDLSGNNLSVGLDGLKLPSTLETLVLSNNNFSGPIPDNILNPNLVTLDLSYNRFNGKINNNISNMSKLTSLKLNNNFLSGYLPTSLTSLNNLNTLNLCGGDNLFYISDENDRKSLDIFLASKGIKAIDCYKTNLSPREQDSLTLINFIDKLGIRNQFSNLEQNMGNWKTRDNTPLLTIDPITNRINSLNLYKVYKYIDISNRDELNNLTELKKLFVEYTDLVGELKIDKLTKLEELKINTNYRSPLRLPSSIKALTELHTINISENNAIAAYYLPSDIGELKKLKTLILVRGGTDYNTNFKFELIRNIPNLENLQIINININGLKEIIVNPGIQKKLKQLHLVGTGLNSLPSNIGDLSNLEDLKLDYNNLETLPSAIGDLTKLTSINISNNRIKYLPQQMNNLTNLTSITICGGSNSFTTQLPTLFYNKMVSLGSDQSCYILPIHTEDSLVLRAIYQNTDGVNWSQPWDINGELNSTNYPGITISNIGDYKRVTSIVLNGKNLNGNIPEEIGKLTELTTLNLSNNSLKGNVPSSIDKLSKLTTLSLCGGNNRYLGEIPQSVKNLTTNKSLGNITCNYFLNHPDDSLALKAIYDSLDGANWTNIRWNMSGNIRNYNGVSFVESGNYMRVSALNLRKNGLSGKIPSHIGNMLKLGSIKLDSNTLIGNLPSKMELLREVSVLHLNGNNGLTGALPGILCGVSDKNIDNTQITTCALITQVDIQPKDDVVEIFAGDTLEILATLTPSTVTVPQLSWSVNNNDLASINSNGRLIGKGVGKVKVTARSQDGTNLSDTVNITTKNIYTDMSYSGISEIAENLRVNTFLGKLTTQDAKTIGKSSYMLENHQPYLFIRNDSIFTKEVLDFETQEDTLTAKIKVRNGLGSSFSKIFIFTIKDVFENVAPTDIQLTKQEIDENMPINTLVGFLKATDENDGDVITFSLLNSVDVGFKIVKDSLLTTKSFDYENGDNVINLIVQASDQHGGSSSKKIVIFINDVNDNKMEPNRSLAIEIDKEIIISPNPVKNIVNITIPSWQNSSSLLEVNIFSMNGKLVYSQNYEKKQETLQINLSDLVNGIYILNLKQLGVEFERNIRIIKK